MRLHTRVLACLARLFTGRKRDWLDLLEVPVGVQRGGTEAAGCVQAWLRVLEKLGMRPSCLARSVLLCRVLRQCGVDAKVTFGVTGGGGVAHAVENRIRHCWVEEAGDETPEGWKPVLRLP